MDINYLSELRKLDKIYKKKKLAEAELSTSFEDFLSTKGVKKPERLVQKSTNPSRSSFLFKLITAFIIVSLTILFLVLTVSAARSFFSSRTIQDDPGAAFYSWLDEWDNVSSFDDLMTSWMAVEEDWASKGIDVDWNFVIRVRNENFPYAATIYSDSFSDALLYEVFDYYNTPFLLAFYIVLTFIGIILSIAFILKTKRATKKYLTEHRLYIDDTEHCRSFNDITFPRLLFEYEASVKKLSLEYSEKISLAADELKQCEAEIEPYYDFLSKKYYPYLDFLIDILECGRADDLKEALRVLNSDISAERARAEEREWRERQELREAIHYQAMESYAKNQADAAARQADMAEKNLELEKKARKDEAFRARQAESQAHSRCYNCAHYYSCRHHGVINCAAFLPKS